MNLKIGRNIRAYRKQLDITQEQLADKLGVSFQSVSRWENETTYPDMELLPVMARIFQVSVDKLLGIPEAEKEEKAKETLDELRREVLKNERDIPKIVQLIRDIRRNFIDCTCMWKFWVSGNDFCYRHPEILPEVRLTAEDYIENTKSSFQRCRAIEVMANIEEEDRIDAFLEKYASSIDISENALLRQRYLFQREYDKYEWQRKLRLFSQMDELLDRRTFREKGQEPDIKTTLDMVRFQLNTLHGFCKTDPDTVHPVSGDGTVDFWIEPRLDIGFSMASCLTALGEKDAALTVLEDCTALIESIMGITEPTRLSSRSPWLKDFLWEAKPTWSNLHNDPDGDEEYAIFIEQCNGGDCYMIFPSIYYTFLTTWKAFDELQEDSRYRNIAQRLKDQVKIQAKQEG